MIPFKSKGLAWGLWLFLGGFGAHNFYVGKKGAGIAQALLTLSIIGIVISLPWVLIDAFYINGNIDQYNARVWQQNRINEEWERMKFAPTPSADQPTKEYVDRMVNESA